MVKSILKHSARYFSTSIFTAGLSFAMLKYYTAVLTPEEFGIYSMYFIMIQYVAMLVFFYDGGFSIMYFKTNDKKEYVNLNISFMIILSVVLFIISFLLMPFIVPFISNGTYDIYIASLVVGIGAGFIKMFYRILINEELSATHRKVSVLQATFNHGFSFILMSFFHLGVMGRQLGQLFGQTINIFQVLKFLREKLDFKFKFITNFKDLVETYHLAWPIFLSSLMVVIFSYTDRIFLNYFNGLSDVGIYSLGFTIGQSLSMVNDAISLAFYPQVMKMLNLEYEKGIKSITKIAIIYYLFLTILATTLAFLAPFVIKLISNKQYYNSSDVVSIIFIAFLIGGFYKIPTMILSFHKITKFYPILSFFAFGINSILNYIFIPKFGILGAAFATLIGTIIYSYFIQFMVFKYVTIQYKIVTTIFYILAFLIGIYFSKGIFV